MRRQLRARSSMALILLAALVISSPAAAQPNPFEAYEGKRQRDAERQPARGDAPAAAECDCPEVPPDAGVAFVSEELTRRGGWILGGATAFSFTTSTNDTDGGSVNNSTLFVRLAPTLGFFVLDRLEVHGSVGLLWRQIARDTDSSSTGRDVLFEAGARYHLPVSERFSFIPGLSLGGYLGRSERDSQVIEDGELKTIAEETSTYGGVATLRLDLGYLLTPQLELQAGVGLVGLIGAERVASEQASFGVRTLNTGLSLGIGYYF